MPPVIWSCLTYSRIREQIVVNSLYLLSEFAIYCFKLEIIPCLHNQFSNTSLGTGFSFFLYPSFASLPTKSCTNIRSSFVSLQYCKKTLHILSGEGIFFGLPLFPFFYSIK